MMQDTSDDRIRADQPIRHTGSLRTRLIVTSVVVTAIAVAAMGYYVYYRAQQSNAFLADQLESSVQQQAESTLTSIGNQQVDRLNAFFSEMRRDISDAGLSAAGMLSQQTGLDSGLYWDATTSLARLPNGSWDNAAATDPASVFLPAQVQLTDGLVQELNTLKHLDFVVPGKLQANPDAVAVYFGGTTGETLYYPNIDLAAVVPSDFDVTQRPWYLKASPRRNPDRGPVWSEPYADAALHGLVVTTSVPVFDAADAFRGVIAMDVQLGRITDIVSSIRAGETGYAFLIDRDQRLIALPPSGYADLGLQAEELPLGERLDAAPVTSQLPPALPSILDKMSAGGTGLETVAIGGVDRFVVYQIIPEVGYSMAIIVPTRELLAGAIAARAQLAASSTNTTQVSLVLVAFILMLATIAMILLGNTLTSPLTALTQTAEEITAGNLNARAPVQGRDEIGLLAKALNAMTGNLREMVQSLEQRVRDRTAALAAASEEANRRAVQFEAITRVTRAISSIRNVDELMPLVTSVISEAFGYYHVGVFLNDLTTQNSYLIAANSEGGRRMLGRHHGLRIGEQGIVGYVAARGEPRVARNVGEDIVFFNNPDLPATRSEAALPLRSSDRVIGVLDVQSTKEDAFKPDDLRILAVLADQVSLAIENTRLFETTQRSLNETQTLYRQYVREAWRTFQSDEPAAGYHFTATGAMPLDGARLNPGEEGDQDQRNVPSGAGVVRVPIMLRGETIGNLVVGGAQAGGWSPEQIDLMHAVAERVALSAENARLFDETSRRAAREHLVTEITSKIRSATDPQEMMRTALDELKTALGATHIQVIPQAIPDSQGDREQPPPPPDPAP